VLCGVASFFTKSTDQIAENTRQKAINCSEKYMQKFSLKLMIMQYFVGNVPLILVMFAVH